MRDIFSVKAYGGVVVSSGSGPTNLDPPPEQTGEVAAAVSKRRDELREASKKRIAFDEALMSGICPHCAAPVTQRSRMLRDDFFECKGCGRVMETLTENANKFVGD